MVHRVALVAAGSLLAACAGLFTSSSLGSQSANGVLEAVVGTNDGFDIGLFFPDGRRVITLEPGTYDVVVHDRSALHNFHLASNFDSTVDFRTELAFVGDQTFTVTFKPNTVYAYACEPHWQVMNGSFRTLALAPTTTTSPTTTTPPQTTQTVRARVSPTGAVSLRPALVRSGVVTVVVADQSSRSNFHLMGKGVNRRTTRAFTGTVRWRLRLAPGLYRFGSDPRQLRGMLRVR